VSSSSGMAVSKAPRVGFGSGTARPAPSALVGTTSHGLATAVPSSGVSQSNAAASSHSNAGRSPAVARPKSAVSRPGTVVGGKKSGKNVDPSNILDIDPDSIGATDVDINFDAFFRG